MVSITLVQSTLASVHRGLNQMGSIPHGLSPPGLSPPGLNPPGLNPPGTEVESTYQNIVFWGILSQPKTMSDSDLTKKIFWWSRDLSSQISINYSLARMK